MLHHSPFSAIHERTVQDDSRWTPLLTSIDTCIVIVINLIAKYKCVTWCQKWDEEYNTVLVVRSIIHVITLKQLNINKTLSKHFTIEVHCKHGSKSEKARTENKWKCVRKF